MLKTCATCGELSDQSYCPAHQPKRKDTRVKDKLAAGYDYQWSKLSRRARRLQPFCTDCGTPKDLTADHTPEAWKRKEQGKPIRLQDIEVVCRSCNSKRGAARGKNARSHSKQLTPLDDTNPHATPKRLLDSRTRWGVTPQKVLSSALEV